MLSPLQERVARIVASLPAAEGFALAGGAALVIAEVVDRQTRDLDFFGATAARVDDDSGDTTEIDLGVDARIWPAQPGPLGPMLALEELAADKMLALFERAQARDFVDVAALAARLGFDPVCELAAEKDPGFSLAVLREAWRDHLTKSPLPQQPRGPAGGLTR